MLKVLVLDSVKRLSDVQEDCGTEFLVLIAFPSTSVSVCDGCMDVRGAELIRRHTFVLFSTSLGLFEISSFKIWIRPVATKSFNGTLP